MPNKPLILLCALLLGTKAPAQHPDDEYYPYEPRAEERAPELVVDTSLFYRAVQTGDDLFAAQTDYTLSFVAAKRRGAEPGAEPASLCGIGIPMRYATALRLVGFEERRYTELNGETLRPGSAADSREFAWPEGLRAASRSLAAGFSDRNYLARIRMTVGGPLGRGWSGTAAADLRTGRDMHVRGVFTEAATAACALRKRFGDDCDLLLTVVLPAGSYGMRTSSVEEAFVLLDDPLYNPCWGYQNGKVRNSRIRRECVPLLTSACRLRLSETTVLHAAAGLRAGIRKFSSLGWYDARTPMPDHYKYLPSHTGDRETQEAWRSNDTHLTQIDWDELWQQNRMAGRAVHALEERVERLADVQCRLGFRTEPDDRFSFDYGLAFRRTDSRRYKRMRDLLGAPALTDIDHYLVDDDTYGNLLQNDLRHPGRQVREGDRFGYDYSLVRVEAGGWVRIAYRSDRLLVRLDAELREAAIRRRGHFEKELFPGSRSYGPSRRIRLTPYTIRGSAGYSFSPRSYLEIAAAVGAETPRDEELFLQPQYNNRTVDRPVVQRTLAAEANYRLTGRTVALQATLFVRSTLDESRTLRYYDDLAATYCDLAVSGIGRLHYGAEAALEWRPSYRWTLTAAASAARYAYSRDPHLTVYSDTDNTIVENRAVSHMGGCTTGGAPQLCGTAGAAYFGPHGWGFRAAASFAGARYVEPAYLRRTERIARQAAASREAFDAFMRQERLGDLCMLDATLFKTFRFGRSRLTATLMVRNLLNRRRDYYDGYESLRVGRSRSGDDYTYAPRATRYLAVYPRSVYLTISYKF